MTSSWEDVQLIQHTSDTEADVRRAESGRRAPRSTVLDCGATVVQQYVPYFLRISSCLAFLSTFLWDQKRGVTVGLHL